MNPVNPVTSLAQRSNEVILSIFNISKSNDKEYYSEKLKYISSEYPQIDVINHKYSMTDNSFYTRNQITEGSYFVKFIFKYKTYLVEPNEYVYINNFTLTIDQDLIEIQLEYKILPKVTYFETIPEDLLYVISFYTKSDPGFVGSSKNVENAYRKYLVTIVKGYENNFNSIDGTSTYIRNEGIKYLGSIKILSMKVNRDIITDRLDKNFETNTIDDISKYYVVNPFESFNNIRIFSGKLKNDVYFVILFSLGYPEKLIFSTTWKFVWDKLSDEVKETFYRENGYDKVFELLEYQK